MNDNRGEIGVGMVGHAFMGAVHSQAWRNAHRFFDLPLVPRLSALGGRDATRTREAADKYGWAAVETDWAALVQRESGPDAADMAKIARVFQNRLDRGMLLQSDATVAYGTGNTHTVWTEPEERADASNPYNTYANPGMPIGPIGLPGLDAINSAISPAEGDWLYFVPINLKTGETVFSETAEQHEAAAAQLRAWCRESAENASYCA